jgi:hypothetical protein
VLVKAQEGVLHQLLRHFAPTHQAEGITQQRTLLRNEHSFEGGLEAPPGLSGGLRGHEGDGGAGQPTGLCI